ncbi:MAG: LuxR C-terminal-related transcriptional regulator [Microbacterium sp.]
MHATSQGRMTAQARVIHLTPREREILRRLVGGRSRPEIANDLFISLNTLKTHMRTLYRKLGATTRADAVRNAEREGLLSLDASQE